MNYRFDERLNAKISLLGFGAMRLPITADGTIDKKHAKSMVDAAFAAGINYFDTAWFYHSGTSETFLGEALADYDRASYFLADKLPLAIMSEHAELDDIFNKQLARCKTDYFDFYLLHSIGAGTLTTAKDINAVNYLEKQRAAGKIKRLGFSFHGDMDTLKECIAMHKFDFVQLQLNFFDFYNGGGYTEFYETAMAANLPIIVMEPVRGGFISRMPAEAERILLNGVVGKTPAQLAIEWVANLPGVAVVLSGMSSLEQLEQNIATINAYKPYDNSTYAKQMEACVQFIKTFKTIPCTTCAYCMPCPFGVDIPSMFSQYNTFSLFGNAFGARMAYLETPAENRADKCTACGICVAKCPQSIAIPQRMKEVVAKYAPFVK